MKEALIADEKGRKRCWHRGRSPSAGKGTVVTLGSVTSSVLTTCLRDGNGAYEEVPILFTNHSLWEARKSLSIKEAGAEQTSPPSLFFFSIPLQ